VRTPGQLVGRDDATDRCRLSWTERDGEGAQHEVELAAASTIRARKAKVGAHTAESRQTREGPDVANVDYGEPRHGVPEPGPRLRADHGSGLPVQEQRRHSRSGKVGHPPGERLADIGRVAGDRDLAGPGQQRAA